MPKTPARCAAAISPGPWPASASGSIPQLIHSLASATSTAKTAAARAGPASRHAAAAAAAASVGPAAGDPGPG